MTVFYRGRRVRITHEVIEVWSPIHQSFAIRDLRHVQVAERATDPPMIGAIRTGATGIAGATAICRIADCGRQEVLRGVDGSL